MPHHPVLRFHGAAGTVTGSCFLVDLGPAKVLVDCGMFQGSKSEKELNYREFPFAAAEIDAVILTHAHIDHSGLLPKLAKAGFDGPIFATRGTVDLCSVMLPDSAHIQESEVDQLNRRNQRRGREIVEPIYDASDAARAVTMMRTVALKTWQQAVPGMRFRFWNAGHLLGSASVEMEIETRDKVLRLMFSGDIGPSHKLLQYDPEAPQDFDYVICESTYGDTDREIVDERARRHALEAEVHMAANPNGALLIPSFAVERTQELLADLVQLMRSGAIETCPILIDSPLATRASEIFRRHARELENGKLLDEAMEAHNVRFTETVEQSKAIDNMRGFHIVIAASGMCEAGRIRHHLRYNLARRESTILFVGFQAAGSLGRTILDGASRVRIWGQDVAVRAQIRRIDSYSAHGDQTDLKEWITGRMPINGSLFLDHGEPVSIETLRRLMQGEGVLSIVTPQIGETYSLPTGAPAKRLKTGDVELQSAVGRDWQNDYADFSVRLKKELQDIESASARREALARMGEILRSYQSHREKRKSRQD